MSSSPAAPLRLVEPAPGRGIADSIGHTPLLRLRLFEREAPRLAIHAKAEFMNPGGSVKDRPALRMIQEGERSGALTRGKVILDSTSGNTGVAYAMLGAAFGYRVRLVMPANVSPERRRLCEAYGAAIVLSDPQEGSDGAILRCRELRAEDPDAYFVPDQYNNPANWQAHHDTTGVEIWEQTQGTVTHFLAGLGTAGTFVGCTRRLRSLSPSVQCISLEPDDGFHGLEGLKFMATAIVPGIYDPTLADRKMYGPTAESYALSRELARREGILVGHSSGLALWAVRELIREGLQDGVVVLVFCDRGDRYLSSGLFSGAGR